MNLVYYIIHKEFPTYIHDQDVIQSGMLGLCQAINKWDESKGKLSSYAWSAIRHQIIRELTSRSKHQGLLSLDQMLYVSDDGESSLADYIPAPEDVDFLIAEFDDKDLTHKELEVYELCKKGYNRTQIGEILGIKHNTVSARIRNIKRKRGLDYEYSN